MGVHWASVLLVDGEVYGRRGSELTSETEQGRLDGGETRKGRRHVSAQTVISVEERPPNSSQNESKKEGAAVQQCSVA